VKIIDWRKGAYTWKWVYGLMDEKNGGIKEILWIGTAYTLFGDESNSFLEKRGNNFFLLPPEIETERDKGDSDDKIQVDPDTILRWGFGDKDGLTITQALSDTKDGESIFPEDIELFWFSDKK